MDRAAIVFGEESAWMRFHAQQIDPAIILHVKGGVRVESEETRLMEDCEFGMVLFGLFLYAQDVEGSGGDEVAFAALR
jgi:hypothetical protein